MLRSLGTLIYGIVVAVLIIAVSLFAAVWVIGLAAKGALFGEPRISLAVKIFERLRQQLSSPTDITHITPEKSEGSE